MTTALLLAVWSAIAAPALAAPDAETARQIIDYALKTPTPDMDPKLAGAFLELDVKDLPKKKRERALAKQLELQTLLKITKGKKKGGIRWPTPEGCRPKYYGPDGAATLEAAGFGEVAEGAVDFLEERTKCSESELMCEFSLSIVLIPRKKDPPLKRFFLHANDPLSALLIEYNSRDTGKATQYFGGVLSCNH